MRLNRTDGHFDRKNVNDINKNWEMIEKGLGRLDSSTKENNEFLTKAQSVLEEASNVNKENKEVQKQLNELIIENGDSDAEIIQARKGYDVLNTRLEEMESNTTEVMRFTKKVARPNLNSVEIENVIPFGFEEYINFRRLSGNSYYYPQGLAIDKDHYYILYSPTGKTDARRVILVIDKINLTEVSKFYVGSAGGESLHVEIEGDKRYLYAKSKTSTLGKYDITNIPSDFTTVEPSSEYNVGLFYNFAKIDNEWLIEQDSPTRRSVVTRERFSVYDNDLVTLKREFTINPAIGGHWNGKYNMHTPKRQGIASFNGEIVQVIGGNYYIDDDVKEYHVQGVLKLNSKGEISSNFSYNPNVLVEILRNQGYYVDRIEHESAFTYDSCVYSMVVFNTSLDGSKSVAILKYGSKSPDFQFDEKNAVLITHDKNFDAYKTRTNNAFVNEYTGETISTMQQLLEYMVESGTMEVKFYSSEVFIDDIKGVRIPSGLLVKIENANSRSFWIEYQGVNTYDKYMVVAEPEKNNFSIYERKVSSTVSNDIDLLSLKENVEGFVKNAINAPANVSSRDGFFECKNTGSVGHLKFRPFNTSVTYINLYWGGSYKGWLKETSPTTVS